MGWPYHVGRKPHVRLTILAWQLAKTIAINPPYVILSMEYPQVDNAPLDTQEAGRAASFTKLPVQATSLPAWAPAVENSYGCEPYDGGAGHIHVLERGSCTFEDKAQHALGAKAKGLIVVSNSSAYWAMPLADVNDTRQLNLFAIMVAKPVGDPILRWCRSGGEPVRVSLEQFERPLLDGAEVVMVAVATAVVALGAYVSTSDLRKESALAQIHRPDEVVEVQSRDAFIFCTFGSGMLIVLYFFMKYLIYVIIVCFCLGAGMSLHEFLSLGICTLLPGTRRRACNIDAVGSCNVSDVLATGPVLALVLSFLRYRNTGIGWIFQDIMGVGFLCTLQKSLRLPNIQVATLLLSFMFFFDIFWVFLSPLLFRGKSVMEEVATAGHTGESVPMLLRLPEFHSSPLSRERMLGFGDMALPGLLVSYCLRYDIMSKRAGMAGYFWPCLIGYAVGLVATMCALLLMQMSQPALLYLVPGTLGTTLCLGLARGELTSLWTGEMVREARPAHGKRNGHRDTAEPPEEIGALVGHHSGETAS